MRFIFQNPEALDVGIFSAHVTHVRCAGLATACLPASILKGEGDKKVFKHPDHAPGRRCFE